MIEKLPAGLMILGIIFVSISTYAYFSLIPDYDEKIETANCAISVAQDVDSRLNILYYINRIQATEYFILSELNAQPIVLEKVNEFIKGNAVSQLSILYQIKHLETPSESTIEQWMEMDIEKIEKEIEDYRNDMENLAERVDSSESRWRKERDSLRYWSAFFQIIGITLTQIGIIFQWEFDKRKNDRVQIQYGRANSFTKKEIITIISRIPGVGGPKTIKKIEKKLEK